MSPNYVCEWSCGTAEGRQGRTHVSRADRARQTTVADIELTFTIPRSWWMSANQRLHWADKARRTRTVRRLAYTSSVDLGLEPFGTVHVAAFIGYLTGGRADPANAAPVVKAAIDGLVDAGLLVDDDSTHVIGPTFLRDPKSPTPGHYTVRLVLKPMETP